MHMRRTHRWGMKIPASYPHQGGHPLAPPPSPPTYTAGHPVAPSPSPLPATPPPPPTYGGSEPPTYPVSSTPPPPGVDRLPPTDISLASVKASNGTELPDTPGMGLVKIRSRFGSNQTWSFLCGDTWSGWDANTANVACRQAGFPAGGEPLRVWSSSIQPQMFLGRLRCSGAETSLSACVATGAPEQMIDYWQLGVSGADAAGACDMLAGVRCRIGAAASAAVVLRAASGPSPSGTAVTGNYTGTAIRLEASVGSGPFGAVCLDDGFDNSAASVACRVLGYTSGIVYPPGAPKGTLAVGVKDPTLDAQGSFLGTLSSVRCSGAEANMTACASWRANVGTAVIPCRAAAWVLCDHPNIT
ncbi:hypothetical protein Vafri_17350 [Volvox africanus]|uniref:SRCR domain-containing protein n=1 Tax=Volvox africanus TaxID=51714 RepID=A0A8J4BKE9_9CHLO|nr:hypothetical protein Vafri_17350 [Volvox africanus]